MLPADMCLLMLPWRALTGEFPGFERPHNPMLDPIQQYLPWRIYAVSSVRAGLIPLWNSYAFCGTPFLANLQSTVLYPLNAIFLLTGARHGFGVSALLHLALGGLFMYGFLRALRLHPAAALLGALVLMFSGFTVAWLEYPTLSLWTFMWLPLVLLSYQRALAKPCSLWTPLCAVALGLQFLGGHLQISVYIVLAFLLYALVRVIRPNSAGQGRGRAVLLALLALLVGLALSAGQILPTLELAGLTGRVSHGAEQAVQTAFPLTHLSLYLMPNLFGNPVDYNYWGSFRDLSAFNFFETSCYVGIATLVLALVALRRWREPAWWFLGGLVMVSLLVALGSPLYWLLHKLVPGFKELAGVGRVLCLATFGLAGLAAMGLDDLLTLSQERRMCPVFVGGFLMVAVATAALLLFAPVFRQLPSEWEFQSYLARQLGVFVVLLAATVGLIALRLRGRLGARAFAWVIVPLTLVDLFAFGVGFNPFVEARLAYPDTQTTRWLQEHSGPWRVTSLATGGMDWMAHNSAMVFGLRDIHGSDSLRVRRSFELVSPEDGNQARHPDPGSPLMDALGVRYLVTRRAVSAPWQAVDNAEAPIYVNPRALPRGRIVYRVTAADDGQALAALRTDRDRLAREALASPEEAAALVSSLPGETAAPPASPVHFDRDEPNALTLSFAAAADGLAVITDSYYPGWKAWVDGNPAPIYRVNYGFRGIPVPEGSRTLELKYEPASFLVGLFLSLLGVAVTAGVTAAIYFRARASTEATVSRS